MDEAECTICREGESAGPLRSLCGCRGSMGFIHRHCLIHWLRYSHESITQTVPVCTVCMQPFNLEVPSLGDYVRMRLFSNLDLLANDLLSALLSFCHHVAQEPCTHPHCLALRWGLVLLFMQLALWQGQLCMICSFWVFRHLLVLDQIIDMCLPSTHDPAPF